MNGGVGSDDGFTLRVKVWGAEDVGRARDVVLGGRSDVICFYYWFFCQRLGSWGTAAAGRGDKNGRHGCVV